MKLNTNKTITTDTEIRLTGIDIAKLLKKCGELEKDINPDITFEVPGGGDWSNMEIDINKDNCIVVRYKTINKE